MRRMRTVDRAMRLDASRSSTWSWGEVKRRKKRKKRRDEKKGEKGRGKSGGEKKGKRKGKTKNFL